MFLVGALAMDFPTLMTLKKKKNVAVRRQVEKTVGTRPGLLEYGDFVCQPHVRFGPPLVAPTFGGPGWTPMGFGPPVPARGTEVEKFLGPSPRLGTRKKKNREKIRFKLPFCPIWPTEKPSKRFPLFKRRLARTGNECFKSQNQPIASRGSGPIVS